MKTHTVYFLIVALFLGLSISTATSAQTHRRHHRALVVTSDYKGSTGVPAHVVIKRIPDLGRLTIAALWIDDVPVGGIAYGGTYEGSLSPGRHLISILGVPSPAWPPPNPVVVDVRGGRTYNFTAMGDHSGHLTIVPTY